MMMRKVHISFPAVPFGRAGPAARPALLSSSSRSSSFMARRPAGVAAQDSPSMLAIRLAAICFLAGWSSSRAGNRKFSTGPSFAVRAPMRPAPFPISMIPLQKAMIPSMVTLRVTASLAELITASVTSGRVP